MSAQLFIRGMKDPIRLSDEEGKIAEGLIADPSKPRETPFRIEGVWTGTKGDLRYVVFEKKEEPRPAYDPDKEDRERRARMANWSPEAKAEGGMGRFAFNVFGRSGFRVKEPSAELRNEALQLSIAYFTEHPDQVDAPTDIWEPILLREFGPRKGTARDLLANKMKVNHEEKPSGGEGADENAVEGTGGSA
jgi:hypothetical protein